MLLPIFVNTTYRVMKLIKTSTGKEYKGVIEKIKRSDVEKLKGNKDFEFDWSREADNDVYKIKRAGKKETLGLMSLEKNESTST